MALAALVATAVKPATLAQTVVAVVLDLSRPWTIKSALEQWTSALEGELLTQINQLPVEQRGQLYNAVKQHILTYEDPVRFDSYAARDGVCKSKRWWETDGFVCWVW
jgi:hypothetical protein